MATSTFTQEFNTSLAPEEAFKSFILDGANSVLKAFPHVVKSVDREAGRIINITLAQGGHVKVKVDVVDTQNNICKFTLIEGPILGNKMESITYEEKYEPSSIGGTVLKVNGELRSKAGYTCSAQDKAQAMSLFKDSQAEAFFNGKLAV